MPYTLLTAATLGFDLARRPGGALVAHLLLAGLTADADLLRRLAAAHPRPTGPGSFPYAVSARRAREAAAAAPQLRALTAPKPDTLDGVALTALAHSPFGSSHHVEQLLRTEVFGPDHHPARRLDRRVREDATDVLANAMIAAWGHGWLPAATFAQLLDPYLAAAGGDRQPDLPDLGPAGDQLTIALSRLLERRDVINERWRTRPYAALRPRDWADAMHEACWATHLAGRTRTVAAAHLLAVQIFQAAHLGPPTDRGNLWNLLAGFVQATAVSDLLEQTAWNTLTRPWGLLVG